VGNTLKVKRRLLPYGASCEGLEPEELQPDGEAELRRVLEV
jgi:hypothetical protein